MTFLKQCFDERKEYKSCAFKWNKTHWTIIGAVIELHGKKERSKNKAKAKSDIDWKKNCWECWIYKVHVRLLCGWGDGKKTMQEKCF